MIDMVELIMGVVVSCDDKEEYIQRIIDLDQKTQEDLQVLIERSMQRLRMDFGDPSVMSENPSYHVANQKRIETLEREKATLLEKIEELEHLNKTLMLENKQQKESIKTLESHVETVQQSSSSGMEGLIDNLKGISELEAQLQFRDREYKELSH